MTRNTRSTVALIAAVVLGLAGCTSSTPDRAGGRGLQEVTVLEIAQLSDVAPVQVQAYAAEVEKQSHGSLRLHFNDSWHKGEVDFEKHTLEDVTGGRMPGAWVGVRSLDLIGVKSFQPLVAPLLVDSLVMQNRIFSEGIPLEMARGLEGHGLVAVAVLPGAMRKVLGVRKPFREPADFRGAVLGIQGGSVPEATALALGATFTRMPSGAKLAGVDAFEQQLENIVGNFYGLEAKYITANVNLWPQAMAVVLNDASYRELTDAQREVLLQGRNERDPGGPRGDSDRGRLPRRHAVWTGCRVPALVGPAARRLAPGRPTGLRRDRRRPRQRPDARPADGSQGHRRRASGRRGLSVAGTRCWRWVVP